MMLSEKLAVINEVCDEIKKMNDEDALKYESKELVRNVIHMETLNVDIVRSKLVLEALQEAGIPIEMAEEEES